MASDYRLYQNLQLNVFYPHPKSYLGQYFLRKVKTLWIKITLITIAFCISRLNLQQSQVQGMSLIIYDNLTNLRSSVFIIRRLHRRGVSPDVLRSLPCLTPLVDLAFRGAAKRRV